MRHVAPLRTRLGISLTALVAWLIFAPESSLAQQRGRPEPDPFSAEGTIQALAPGKIQMLTNTNQTWIVMVPPRASVHVRGTAVASFLRPGQFVRFKADIDAQGVAQGKLAELTIFTPEKPDEIGVQPENAAEGQPAPAFGAGARRPGDAAPPQVVACTVAGRITGLREGKLSVHVGRGVVVAELTDTTRLLVDLADYTLARPGDKISVVNGQIGRPGLAQAGRVTIDLTHTLGAPMENQPQPGQPLRPQVQPQGELPR